MKLREILNEINDMKLSSLAAVQLYMKMLDYLTMTDDPHYSKIRGFRKLINKIKVPGDREKLINYFREEFGKGIGAGNTDAWDYYE